MASLDGSLQDAVRAAVARLIHLRLSFFLAYSSPHSIWRHPLASPPHPSFFTSLSSPLFSHSVMDWPHSEVGGWVDRVTLIRESVATLSHQRSFAERQKGERPLGPPLFPPRSMRRKYRRRRRAYYIAGAVIRICYDENQ